jgi:hypothetical protein
MRAASRDSMLSFIVCWFREESFGLRSRKFTFAVPLSGSSFHDRRRTSVDVQRAWFHQGERDLRRRRSEPDGGRKALITSSLEIAPDNGGPCSPISFSPGLVVSPSGLFFGIILFRMSTIVQQSLPNQATLISKRKTYLCYCIFESCNGAQEVERQATDSTGGMDFGSGLTANVSPF